MYQYSSKWYTVVQWNPCIITGKSGLKTMKEWWSVITVVFSWEFWCPSKQTGSASHLTWTSLEALAQSRPPDSCTPASFRTRSVWPKTDTVSQNQIGSGLVLQMIWAVCGGMLQSLKVGNWYCDSWLVLFCQNQACWFLCTGLLLDQMHLAKT